MLVVAADDFHMLADAGQQLALRLALFAPAAEIALEVRLLLAAIIVIVAVEVVHLPTAPIRIVAVVVIAGRSREPAKLVRR